MPAAGAAVFAAGTDVEYFQIEAKKTAMDIGLKRAYDPPEKSDGTRVLVDRLWPRGLSKAKGQIDLWLRDIAPSVELRKWFGHDAARWEDFVERYGRELDARPELLHQLAGLAAKGRLTLIFGARDRERNNAVVLHRRLMPGGRGR